MRHFFHSLFLCCAVLFTCSSAFAGDEIVCKMSVHYRHQAKEIESSHEIAEKAASQAMEAGCEKICNHLGENSEACPFQCIKDGIFRRVKCIRVDKTPVPVDIELIRTSINHRNPSEKSAKHIQRKDKNDSIPLVMTQWYGDEKSSSYLLAGQNAKPKHSPKYRKDLLLNIKTRQQPLILSRPPKAPLLKMR